MTYEDIQVPISGQPISKSQYGDKVRSAILDLDARVRKIESTLSNYAYKLVTTTRASTVTFTDDPDLKVWLEANSRYFVEMFLCPGALAAADIQTLWTVPSGSTGGKRVMGPASGSTVNVNADNATVRLGAHVFGTAVLYNGIRDAGGNNFTVVEHGIVATGVTAGYVTLQWTQGTSNATGTQLGADSFMRATKLTI